MDIQWPLVLFSLIAGTGGSLFAFVALSELVGGKDKTRFAATVTVLVLIVVGGCLSMLHLASPQNAFAALTNIFSFSGISIELMLLGLTFVAAAAYAIVVKRVRNAAAAKVARACRRHFGFGPRLFLRLQRPRHRGPADLDDTSRLPSGLLSARRLACGAFAYDAIAAALRRPLQTSCRGRMPVALMVCTTVSAVAVVAYAGALGLRCGHGPWRCVLGRSCVVRHRRNPGCRLVRLVGRTVPALPVDAIGLICAFVGGVSIRVLMWVCATGYLDLFAHTVPSVMLNL